MDLGPDAKQVTIYTDGACLGNPGPGGYGAVLIYKDARKEMAGGFSLTTNNRMEMMAAIVALEALKQPCRVTQRSDSEYLVGAVQHGWAKRWQANGWRRSNKEPALNLDLWQRLLELCDKHEVRFEWVRGHAGDKENERCDYLASQAALGPDLASDLRYEMLAAGSLPGVNVT
jgi:ribonuclease HI